MFADVKSASIPQLISPLISLLTTRNIPQAEAQSIPPWIPKLDLGAVVDTFCVVSNIARVRKPREWQRVCASDMIDAEMRHPALRSNMEATVWFCDLFILPLACP